MNTRVEWFPGDVTIEQAVNTIVTDSKLSPGAIEYTYVIPHKEIVNNLSEYKPCYRICIVWDQKTYEGNPPPVIIYGRELRKIATLRYRVYTHPRAEHADLQGREHFRYINTNRKSWDQMITTTSTTIANQMTGHIRKSQQFYKEPT